jgi:PAS domain S-box-containing protein
MHKDLLAGRSAPPGADMMGWGDGTVSNELFVAAIESCPVGLSISDATRPSQPLIYVNSAFSGITGYFLQEVVGNNLSFLHGPDTDSETVGRIGATLAMNQPVDAEVLQYRRDGTPFWCEVRMTPLSQDGQIVALIGVHNDITEKRQRRLEDQRRQKLQALGQLAGGVAHEINNLLQPILTYTDLVLAATRDPVTARRLNRVVTSAEKARDIVRGILRFSRGEGSPPAVTALQPALFEALEFVRGLLPVTVAVAITGLDRDLGQGRVSGVELTQVLTNLLTNAAQAMQGRGTITIDADRVGIEPAQAVSLAIAPGHACRVTVADDGPGMDEAVLAHVFDPFFTTKPVGLGTGLGLSVVYGIVQDWRGAISVTSTPGQGATFTFYVPCVEEGAIPHQNRDDPGPT